MPDYPRIDVAEFGRSGQRLVFDAPLADLARIADLVTDNLGCLAMSVEGRVTARSEPHLTCIIHGSLRLQCQRCLQPFDYELAVHSQLVFVADKSLLPAVEDEAPDTDYLLLEKSLDLRELLQDEVILALPVAPMHAPGACGGPISEPEREPPASPFARLAALKKR